MHPAVHDLWPDGQGRDLRWRERRSLFRLPDEVFRPAGYDVAAVSDPAAKAFVQAHHYSPPGFASGCSAAGAWSASPSSRTPATTGC